MCILNVSVTSIPTSFTCNITVHIQTQLLVSENIVYTLKCICICTAFINWIFRQRLINNPSVLRDKRTFLSFVRLTAQFIHIKMPQRGSENTARVVFKLIKCSKPGTLFFMHQKLKIADDRLKHNKTFCSLLLHTLVHEKCKDLETSWM